jgi:hypothetical protein
MKTRPTSRTRNKPNALSCTLPPERSYPRTGGGSIERAVHFGGSSCPLPFRRCPQIDRATWLHNPERLGWLLIDLFLRMQFQHDTELLLTWRE